MQRRTSFEFWSAVTALVVAAALTTPLWAAPPDATASEASPVAGASWEELPVAEREGCLDHGNVPAAPQQQSEGRSPGGVSQPISVTVPRTAIVRVDDRGQVLAAMTNTGCPPGASDDVWHRHPDGSLVRAPAGAADRDWVGDFSERGVFVAQPAAGT